MALFHCEYFSDALGMQTKAEVILPQPTSRQIGIDSVASTSARYPVLYLLHGLSDDETIWMRRTSIERYVSTLGLAVVMPTVHRGYYADQMVGLRYWTYVSEELPRIMGSFFPLSDRREDTFAAGLSMGGYGAFKLALRCPDSFAAAASLSGGLDTARHAPNPEWTATFGDSERARREGDDLFELAERLDVSASPLLYQWCGTEDFLYDDNVLFHEHAARLGLPLTYEESTGGHDWALWDLMIRRVLDWLPLRED